MTLRAHPYADKFPMLAADALAEMADSIATVGLLHPIVVTSDGLVLDGRNRAAACELIGVEPETTTYEGDDLAGYVIAANVARRNQNTGQRAMSTALVLAEDGRRENGRWKRGSVAIGEESNISGWRKALNEAGIVLDYAPDLAPFVVDGTTTLHDAYQQADKVRRDKDADELARKAKERADRERAKKAKERDAAITKALGGTKYADLIANGTMTPTEAEAAHMAATEAERRAEAAASHSRKVTCQGVASRAFAAEGGADEARVYLRDFYPHEAEHVEPSMRLTSARVKACIDFYTTLLEGIAQ